MGAACAKCLLDCLDRAMQYFNKYAFVYVAVYGKPFKAAGKECWDLFMNKGFGNNLRQFITEDTLL